MSVDTLGRAARTAVQDRTAALPIPPVDRLGEISHRRKRRRAVAGSGLVAAAAVVLAGVVVSAFLLGRSPEPPATPSGVVPRHVEQHDLGYSVDLPSTFVDTTGPTCRSGGWQYCAEQRSPADFFLSFHITDGSATPAQVAARRSAYLQGVGIIIKSTGETVIDGHPAAKLDYIIPRSARTPKGPIADVEYDVVYDKSLTLGFIIGEPSPRPDPDIPPWVASTIRITLPRP